MKQIIISLLFCILLAGHSFSQDGRSYTKDPLKLTEFATDQTETLRPKEYIKLKNRLQRFYDSTSTQIVFLMINSLNGESIEEVANSIFRFNQIGSNDKNNGVLFLIAKNDRKIRIEVGYGLEGVLTDATCKMIIKNVITPYLKEDNYLIGINRGVDAIEAVVRGEFANDKFPEVKENESFFASTAFFVLVVILIIIVPIILIIIFVAKGKLGRKEDGYLGKSYSTGSSNNYSSDSSSYTTTDSTSSSSSSDSGFTGGGGDSGGGGASGDY